MLPYVVCSMSHHEHFLFRCYPIGSIGCASRICLCSSSLSSFSESIVTSIICLSLA